MNWVHCGLVLCAILLAALTLGVGLWTLQWGFALTHPRQFRREQLVGSSKMMIPLMLTTIVLWIVLIYVSSVAGLITIH